MTMARSNYLMIPVSGNGIIVDPGTKDIIQKAMVPPFGYSDVLLYSHGWWTTAQTAMVDYNRFLMGFSPIAVTADTAAGVQSRVLLGLGVHWPSMLSEDANTPLTVLQPFTYFNRARMADAVGEHGGYSLLRVALEARRDAGIAQPRIQLVGHSFGCKVVCSALEQLAETPETSGLLADLEVNVVLLQGAFDNDALEPGKSYGQVLSVFPKLRILASKSQLDTAVGDEYMLVQRVMNLFGTPTPGLGSAGPSPATAVAAGGMKELQVGPGFAAPAGSLAGRLIVADLTPLHQANPAGNAAFAGHHSDIFHDEIYRLMTTFFFA
jgi:hypothetical protein